MKKANHILVLMLTITFWGCTNEEPVFQKDNILGRWEIKEATRNGKPTESLDQLFFEFFADGTMTTNLSGTRESANYEIEEDQIFQRESQFDVDYTIRNLSDSTLDLTTQLRDYFFKLSLAKKIQEE